MVAVIQRGRHDGSRRRHGKSIKSVIVFFVEHLRFESMLVFRPECECNLPSIILCFYKIALISKMKKVRRRRKEWILSKESNRKRRNVKNVFRHLT
jgi:hypothetical protein